MTRLPSISLFDQQGVEQLRREWKLDPSRIRSLRNTLLKRFESDSLALEGFPAADRLLLHSLELFRRCDSSIDGATKLLLRTVAGMLIEAVILRIETGRTTLCVSSQVGCAAACEFCATGKMGIARNLSTDEILDQVLLAGQLLAGEGRTLRNIVFMGMGEPFHNEDNLYRAVELLISPSFFNIAPTKVLVSTVGVADAMLRCVERFPKVNLALSLHSVRQEVREKLIPLATKFPLDQLHRTVAEANRRQSTSVMIEYLMLAGVNDSQDDARELAAWLSGLNVHVNLIPYNPIEDSPQLVGSDRETRLAFAKTVRDHGFKTTVRYSLGNDIAAACGQLVRRENREMARGFAISAHALRQT
ncbi:MAG TPA: 23S rRNA (adenine(2503)-C(2))-methyltransferase RlmN [Pirellulaceae bacterium]|nr:23S rRNA (adenine(2503)-C(2))-methyltransferase RlmN [Planctomycetales bacterium]MCB9941709.1 23S rRNA (adenine(2503)-C(2))-methyltransferase RlmN [Planctomycetaceae bacterium]HRX80370.1 23S rRNA (adenine(2503)-C(2))-methyltransferase RlmN [Pirellulaceae bacterium]